MKDVKVDLVSWNRFVTRNFAVVPQVLGLACEFQFKKSQIRIELPTDDNLKDETEDSKLSTSCGYGRKRRNKRCFFYRIIDNFKNRHSHLFDGCFGALTDYRPYCNFK